jgi:hypothetical protein
MVFRPGATGEDDDWHGIFTPPIKEDTSNWDYRGNFSAMVAMRSAIVFIIGGAVFLVLGVMSIFGRPGAWVAEGGSGAVVWITVIVSLLGCGGVLLVTGILMELLPSHPSLARAADRCLIAVTAVDAVVMVAAALVTHSGHPLFTLVVMVPLALGGARRAIRQGRPCW